MIGLKNSTITHKFLWTRMNANYVIEEVTRYSFSGFVSQRGNNCVMA